MSEESASMEKTEECIELKNIKYKTMLLNGIPSKETRQSENLSNLEKFLEEEKTTNENEPWCKLNTTVKTKKLLDYVTLYAKKKDLDILEEELLRDFFKECLNRKKLQRVKDVVYDKITGTVKEIPALFYSKSNRHFTLKNTEKRISALHSLKKTTSKKKNQVNKNDTELTIL
jgi:hypothetical protein